VFVHDLVRGVTQRLNTGGFSNVWPEWSPDGRIIAFSSDRDGRRNVYRMPADGTGAPERLAPSTEAQSMSSWSAGGVIAYLQGGAGQRDIWVLPPNGQPTPFLASEASEEYATFSPDGGWLAYVSNETGRPEVYVRPYPGPGAATLISGEGASSPAWSRDGRRIYFVQLRAGRDPVMMVVDVAPGNPFRAGRAAALIDPWPYQGTFPVRSHDLLTDGSFVATLSEGGEVGGGEEQAGLILRNRYRVGELQVVLNFFEELRARVPN
jgi:serine/threonine-protein kinase